MNRRWERNGQNARPPPKQDDDRAAQGTRRSLECEHLRCPLLGVIYWLRYWEEQKTMSGNQVSSETRGNVPCHLRNGSSYALMNSPSCSSAGHLHTASHHGVLIHLF